MRTFYKTSATATGARAGDSALDDGSFTVEMVPPGDQKTGPLFALGHAAWFASATELVAKPPSIALHQACTTAEAGTGQQADDGYGLNLDITTHLPGLPARDARHLIETA